MPGKSYIKQASAAAQQGAQALRGDADRERANLAHEHSQIEKQINDIEQRRLFLVAALASNENDQTRANINRQEIADLTNKKGALEAQLHNLGGQFESKIRGAESAAGSLDSIAGQLQNLLSHGDFE
jgi:chromosome segregation ATPase